MLEWLDGIVWEEAPQPNGSSGGSPWIPQEVRKLLAAGEGQRGGIGALRSADSMVLGPERRARVRQRLEPLLKEYNPDLKFVAVFVDSTREYLGVIAQLADRPVLLKFRWVDFISTPDAAVQADLFAQLEHKLGPSGPSPAQP